MTSLVTLINLLILIVTVDCKALNDKTQHGIDDKVDSGTVLMLR